jgi:hypothetical protein
MHSSTIVYAVDLMKTLTTTTIDDAVMSTQDDLEEFGHWPGKNALWTR